MNEENKIDVFKKKERIIPDGAYSINAKLSKNRCFCIIDQKRNEGASLINGKGGFDAHQCFIIKYNKESGYYSIMALHSHKFLGVHSSETNFCFSLISQYPLQDDYLLYWDINCIGDSFFSFELIGTDLYLELDSNTNLLQLNQKNYNDKMQFQICTMPIIKNGLYQICGKYDSKLAISFKKNSTTDSSILSHNKNDVYSVFYIQFDQKDGCYLIINPDNALCLSKNKMYSDDQFLYQKKFKNFDYQKFIISSFDLKSGDFFFELKSNLLRLEIPKYARNIHLKLSSYQPYFSASKNQIFSLYSIKVEPNKQKEFNDLVAFITEKQNHIYRRELTLSNKTNIKCEMFYNIYFIKKLIIPNSVENIAKKAFLECNIINEIHCDPKWLALLPNPLNVKIICVNETVKEINDEFKNFRNLEELTLPSSLVNVSPKAFENIYNIKVFTGNLNFIKMINTSSLEKVVISSYVKVIPKEAFAGCRLLRTVDFERNTSLHTIESRAFANCESLEPFVIPDSVNNIAPDAFYGCPKESIPQINKESQRLTMLDNLIIDPYVTQITMDYSACFNIESLEIPMTVDDIEKGVFDNFERLKYIKCDPKWLNCFPKSKIEGVFIPDEIDHLCQKDFAHLIYLKLIEIPDNVNMIEEDTFASCNDLTSFKCGTKHLPFLKQEQIKTLVLNNEVKSINKNNFERLINLESLVVPDKINVEDKSIFLNCKKLVQINNSHIANLLNNKAYVEEGTKEIKKQDFEDWINLTLLSIPESVNSIEPDTFNNCININHLICDPKFFDNFTNNCIIEIEIPNFVTELKKGQFDNFIFLTKLKLPDNIKIDDPSIFDSCINLQKIQVNQHVLDSLSEKTKERCIKKVQKIEYMKPNFNFQKENVIYVDNDEITDENLSSYDEPQFFKNSGTNNNNDNDDLPKFKNKPKTKENDSKIDFTHSLSSNLADDGEEEEEMADLLSSTRSNRSYKQKETTIDDLVAFDHDNEEYARHIVNIQMNIIENSVPKTYKPENKSLFEISKVCGSVCYEINRKFKIIPRPVQILVILRLANNILNNAQSHGMVSEIKTGEGKSLVITILTIVLVKFNHKVDIISSNLELVKRDQSEQEPYFECFGIKTGVLYNKYSDFEFFGSLKRIYFGSSEEQKRHGGFNTNVLKCPVVYSTSFNFMSLYLHSIFNMNPRNREYDVVLVDEVDNMFIDESEKPLRIATNINYAYSDDIMEIVFLLQSLDTHEIIKFLQYYFPQIGIFEEDNIEMLKQAAIKACKLTKKIDYIIENGEAVIIDSNTGFKRLRSRWSKHVHEMIEIKEKLKRRPSQVEVCQISQNGFFNFYKKIMGVTGTIGGPADENILRKGYNIDIFRVPRHFESQQKVFIKNRPSSDSHLFKLVCNEIIAERNKGRPVLVIWDSIYNAERFVKSKPFLVTQKILGVNPELDRRSIKRAGNSEIITIATSAAGRGVDIKLSQKVLEAGGLHVIIPKTMANQRSLEQAAGRSGRQGQPGSVTIYTSDDDKYIIPQEFKKGDENLIKLELKFDEYLRKNFPWMLLSPRKYGFKEKLFPFCATPSMVLDILGRSIALSLRGNQFANENEIVQDMSYIMVQMAWGVFFTGLCDNVDECEDWEFVNDLYHDFLRELSVWFPPDLCTTSLKALWHIRKLLIKELDWECIIINGVKITSLGLCIVFPLAAPVIHLASGALLSGGLEIYHQLQRGEKINWVLVLIRSGGSVVRNAIFLKFGIDNKLINMGIYKIENSLYNMAADKVLAIEDNEFYDDELESIPSNSIALSKNIRGTSQNTNMWLCSNIRHKRKKPKHLIKFRPKIYSTVLNIDFIRFAMRLAQDSYEGKFVLGKIILKSEINEMYKPVFYCVNDANNLFVITRGTNSFADGATDLSFIETKAKFDGKDIYFHGGFYYSACYVFEQIKNLLKENPDKTIYFIGHSYGAAVSSILALLAKYDKEIKNKEIYAIAFAPAPAMSYIPPHVSECIYAFINRNDVVTSFSFLNLVNTANKNRISAKKMVQILLNKMKPNKNNWCSFLIQALGSCIDQFAADIHIFHVRKVKGKIFRIGVENKKRINDCKIKESQLPSTIWVELTSLADHSMDEYVRSFKIIKF